MKSTIEELIEKFQKDKLYFEENSNTSNEQFNMITKWVVKYIEDAVITNLKHLQAEEAQEWYEEVECIDFDWDWYIVPKSKVQKFKQYMAEAEEQWHNFDDMKFVDVFWDYWTGWSLDQWPKLFIKSD
jgi:hypothetical protein